MIYGIENKEKIGQEPAFPITHEQFETVPTYKGMSKRFYAACAAMQGLLANKNICNWVSDDPYSQREEVAKTAFSFADYLLKQENE